MSWDLYKKIVDEINLIPTITSVAPYIGGESTLHPKFEMMVSYLLDGPHSYKTTLSTNGMFWTPELSEMVVEKKLDRLHFSMDGVGRKHEQIRVGSKYEVLKKAIDTMIEIKGNNEKPQITLNFVFSDHTEQDLMDWANEWIEKPVTLTMEILQTPEFKIDRDALTKVIQITKGLTTIKQAICTYPFYYVGILWDGRIVPCCSDFEGNLTLGHINDGLLNVFYNGAGFRQLRENELNRSPTEICKVCEVGREGLQLPVQKFARG